MAKSLSNQEMKGRLASYELPEVTNELYSFGSMLVSEIVDRVHKAEAKAGTLAGYSGAILALIVSTFSLWNGHFHAAEKGAMYGAAFMAFVSQMCALWALKIDKFNWFSDNDWLRGECLSDVEALRKYHLLTMHTVIVSHGEAAERKSNRIALAQRFLLVTGVFLLAVPLLALLGIICKLN